MQNKYEETLQFVNPYSTPSKLKITDLRLADIVGAPTNTTFIKIYTNQGVCGFGELRDGASRTYALMLKGRLLGENPCDVDRLFQRVKQFGSHSRQAGGVSGIEVALWDLAGKAYGIPVYQMLGGKFRDRVPVYCDIPVFGFNADGSLSMDGIPDGKKIGGHIKERLHQNWAFYKIGGVEQIMRGNGYVGPGSFLSDWDDARERRERLEASGDRLEYFEARSREYKYMNTEPSLTGVRLTEGALDALEQFTVDMRSVIGDRIQVAYDHVGRMGLGDAIRLGRRLEKYNIAWMEDVFPWYRTDQYLRLSESTTTPLCTGEDIYLKENFEELLSAGAVDVIHPDVLTAGGILETKKIGDMAESYGIPMAVHMVECPVGALAAAHMGVATNNVMAIENCNHWVSWWSDIVISKPGVIMENGYIAPSGLPGLGVVDFNDELLREHADPRFPEIWAPTGEWDEEYSVDRHWC